MFKIQNKNRLFFEPNQRNGLNNNNNKKSEIKKLFCTYEMRLNQKYKKNTYIAHRKKNYLLRKNKEEEYRSFFFFYTTIFILNL